MCKYWLSSGSGSLFAHQGYLWVVTQHLGDTACQTSVIDKQRLASFPFVPTNDLPPVVERAEGCTLYFDDGRDVLDAGGGAIAVNIGHGRIEVADAVAEATRRVSYVLPPWVTEELSLIHI